MEERAQDPIHVLVLLDGVDLIAVNLIVLATLAKTEECVLDPTPACALSNGMGLLVKFLIAPTLLVKMEERA